MLIEEAQVVAVEGSYVLIQKSRLSACNQCAVNKGCGTSVLSRLVGARFLQMKVRNDVGARVGDTVRIGIDEAGLLRSVLLVYVLPLLCIPLFMGGAVLLQGGSLTDAVAVPAALAGLGFATVIAHRLSVRLAANPAYAPVILAIERRAPEQGPVVLAS